MPKDPLIFAVSLLIISAAHAAADTVRGHSEGWYWNNTAPLHGRTSNAAEAYHWDKLWALACATGLIEPTETPIDTFDYAFCWQIDSMESFDREARITALLK